MESNNFIPSSTPRKNASRKWKRSARETIPQQSVGLISSPLHRMLSISNSFRKSLKGIKHPSPVAKNRVRTINEISSQKFTPISPSFPSMQCDVSTFRTVVEGQACKRKVQFDLPEEKVRDSKKGKNSITNLGNQRSAEPEVQACREQ
ncbi:hypothetical protein Ddye_020912 [Dipteronia dyeriana]|uniref:Uncharacterized protein n=1 Tax=Dipteronia dyeriana TaxID=168575 RepID=A0AAD9U172_9ROSI|nr:hypothetical protein Ddye_020912 [Dipteronia dyeriana]